MTPEINDNETIPQPAGAPPGQVLDGEAWRRSTGGGMPGAKGRPLQSGAEGRPLQSGTEGAAGVQNQGAAGGAAGPGTARGDWTRGPDAEGVPKAESHRRMAQAAAAAPPCGQPPGPGGDGALDFREQLESGDAGLPPAWPTGETAGEIRARMGAHRSSPDVAGPHRGAPPLDPQQRGNGRA